jgi:hypothetical protein
MRTKQKKRHARGGVAKRGDQPVLVVEETNNDREFFSKLDARLLL